MPNGTFEQGDGENARPQGEPALDRWLSREIPGRFDELLADPALGIPAEVVRARFEAKRSAAKGE